MSETTGNTDEREAVARAIAPLVYATVTGNDDCREWEEMPEYVQDIYFQAADAALSALAPIRAQEIAAARAEEQGYRHTQVAALNQVHAAEILAAEANERARILSDAAIEAAREYLALCGHEPISDIFIEGAIKEAIKAADALRNEHGAGK